MNYGNNNASDAISAYKSGADLGMQQVDRAWQQQAMLFKNAMSAFDPFIKTMGVMTEMNQRAEELQQKQAYDNQRLAAHQQDIASREKIAGMRASAMGSRGTGTGGTSQGYGWTPQQGGQPAYPAIQEPLEPSEADTNNLRQKADTFRELYGYGIDDTQANHSAKVKAEASNNQEGLYNAGEAETAMAAYKSMLDDTLARSENPQGQSPANGDSVGASAALFPDLLPQNQTAIRESGPELGNQTFLDVAGNTVSQDYTGHHGNWKTKGPSKIIARAPAKSGASSFDPAHLRDGLSPEANVISDTLATVPIKDSSGNALVQRLTRSVKDPVWKPMGAAIKAPATKGAYFEPHLAFDNMWAIPSQTASGGWTTRYIEKTAEVDAQLAELAKVPGVSVTGSSVDKFGNVRINATAAKLIPQPPAIDVPAKDIPSLGDGFTRTTPDMAYKLVSLNGEDFTLISRWTDKRGAFVADKPFKTPKPVVPGAPPPPVQVGDKTAFYIPSGNNDGKNKVVMIDTPPDLQAGMDVLKAKGFRLTNASRNAKGGWTVSGTMVDSGSSAKVADESAVGQLRLLGAADAKNSAETQLNLLLNPGMVVDARSGALKVENPTNEEKLAALTAAGVAQKKATPADWDTAYQAALAKRKTDAANNFASILNGRLKGKPGFLPRSGAYWEAYADLNNPSFDVAPPADTAPAPANTPPPAPGTSAIPVTPTVPARTALPQSSPPFQGQTTVTSPLSVKPLTPLEQAAQASGL